MLDGETPQTTGEDADRAGRRARLRDAIAAILPHLGEVELLMVRLLAARLEFGQGQYALFDPPTDRRDYVAEAVEEEADGVVYLLAEAVRSGLPTALRAGLDRLVRCWRSTVETLHRRGETAR